MESTNTKMFQVQISTCIMCYLCSFPGYSVTTLSDGSTEYFVAGAPRSNHSGQVIVYTVNAQKQSAVIDSERGKQVLRGYGIYMSPPESTCIHVVCGLNKFNSPSVANCSPRLGHTLEASCAPWMWTETGWQTSCWLVHPCSWASWREKKAGFTSSLLPM